MNCSEDKRISRKTSVKSLLKNKIYRPTIFLRYITSPLKLRGMSLREKKARQRYLYHVLRRGSAESSTSGGIDVEDEDDEPGTVFRRNLGKGILIVYSLPLEAQQKQSMWPA